MPTADRPNILFFICHDLGRELGCYGRPVQTPHLDALADDGALFTRAFTNSPACSPSRGCIQTGRYAHCSGMMGLVNGGWTLTAEHRTTPDDLKAAGYLTAHVGLQHERAPEAPSPYEYQGGGRIFAEQAVDDAIDFLDRHRDDRPFYLNVGTIETHESRWSSVMNPQRHEQVYAPLKPEKAYVPAFLPDRPPIREHMAEFMAAITYLDSQFGRLVQALDDRGLRNNTLVIFTTDHGMSGPRAKGELYDKGVEIALIARLPGVIEPGTRIDHLIQNIDIAPTLADAAGRALDRAVDGRSFWPALAGGPYAPHERIFTERNFHGGVADLEGVDGPPWPYKHVDPMRAVRTDRWHYIRNHAPDARRLWTPAEVPPFEADRAGWLNNIWPDPVDPRPSEELYDTQADPHEFTNLADDPRHAGIREQLARTLDQWMQRTRDPLLTGDLPAPNNLHAERRRHSARAAD